MKIVFRLIALAIIGVVIWGLFFFPIRITRSVKVPYSMFKSGEQINNAYSLVKWFSPYTQKDTTRIQKGNNTQLISAEGYNTEISNITMHSSLLKVNYKNNKKIFALSTVTDSSELGTSIITLTYHSSLFNKWFNKSVVEKNAERSLDNLKDYMTDTRRFYGFEIQIVPVEDTIFLFSRTTVPLTQRREATRKIFEKLINYAEKNSAGYNGSRLYYTLPSNTDITIFASIGVSNIIEVPEDSDIQFKRMPFNKNLVATTYQGAFSKSEKAFRALESFITDHSMTSMAIPFQKFLSDGYDFADDQVVQLKVYYPVF